MKHFFLSVLLLAASCTQAQLPEYKIITSGVPRADHGSITRYLVTSAALRCGYTVNVWTPEGYAENTSLTYPVIYAQDGQNLFDPELSYAGVAWELDTKAQSLATRGEAAAPIIVGISNRGAQNLRPCHLGVCGCQYPAVRDTQVVPRPRHYGVGCGLSRIRTSRTADCESPRLLGSRGHAHDLRCRRSRAQRMVLATARGATVRLSARQGCAIRPRGACSMPV